MSVEYAVIKAECEEKKRKLDAIKALEYADCEIVTAAVAVSMINNSEISATRNCNYRKMYSRKICDRAEWLVRYYRYTHGICLPKFTDLYEEMYQKSLELKQLRDKEHLSYFVVIRDKKGQPVIVDSPYSTIKMHFPLKKVTINKYGYASAEQALYARWRMQERIKRGKLDRMLPEVAGGQLEIYHLEDAYRDDISVKE